MRHAWMQSLAVTVCSAGGVRRAFQEGETVIVEVGSGQYRFAYQASGSK